VVHKLLPCGSPPAPTSATAQRAGLAEVGAADRIPMQLGGRHGAELAHILLAIVTSPSS